MSANLADITEEPVPGWIALWLVAVVTLLLVVVLLLGCCWPRAAGEGRKCIHGDGCFHCRAANPPSLAVLGASMKWAGEAFRTTTDAATTAAPTTAVATAAATAAPVDGRHSLPASPAGPSRSRSQSPALPSPVPGPFPSGRGRVA